MFGGDGFKGIWGNMLTSSPSRGWRLNPGEKEFDMLSEVQGRLIKKIKKLEEVNQDLLEACKGLEPMQWNDSPLVNVYGKEFEALNKAIEKAEKGE